MSNLIARTDTWILEHVAEPIAWRVEGLTGRGHFTQAETLLLAWPLASLVVALGDPAGVNVRLAAAALLCGLISGKHYWLIRMVSRPASRLGASFERDLWYLRALWVMFIATLAAFDGVHGHVPSAIYPMPFAELFACWLCACNDPPPREELAMHSA